MSFQGKSFIGVLYAASPAAAPPLEPVLPTTEAAVLELAEPAESTAASVGADLLATDEEEEEEDEAVFERNELAAESPARSWRRYSSRSLSGGNAR